MVDLTGKQVDHIRLSRLPTLHQSLMIRAVCEPTALEIPIQDNLAVTISL